MTSGTSPDTRSFYLREDNKERKDKQSDFKTYPPTEFHSLLHLLPGKQQLLRSYRNERKVIAFVRFIEEKGRYFVGIKGIKKALFVRCYTH